MSVYYGSAAGLGGGERYRPPDWTATGIHAYDTFGMSVAAAGSVNGDGYADLVVGAEGYPQGSGNGKVYVYHGLPSGLGASRPGSWTASGESAGDRFGYAVGTAGDLNGDGCDDLAAGVWGYARLYGQALHLPRLLAAEPGRICPPGRPRAGQAGDYFGWSVSAAGDVNGDGYADLAAGAWDTAAAQARLQR